MDKFLTIIGSYDSYIGYKYMGT